jgi:two-component system sensor histidine kinase/response regulator
MGAITTAERTVFLSTLSPSTRERRFAGAVVLASFILFLCLVPMARVRLPVIWAFIPCYEGALVVIDLITAALMFAQVVLLHAWSLLVLACGYLFCAMLAILHALSFPNLFGPSGVVGGGSQTTAWLYLSWHAGFPLVVMLYALLRGARPLRRSGRAIAAGMGVVALVGAAILYVATVEHDALPSLMTGNTYTPTLPIMVGGVLTTTLLALVVVWWRRPHSVLDLWLMVVMAAWMFDIALAAALNAGRFDLGFYAGRGYGLVAAGIVLLVLLIETAVLYARAMREYAVESAVQDQQVHALRAELIHVSRTAELGQMVSALAHEVNQPLTAVGTYLRAGRRLLQAGETVKADDALRRAGDQVTRAGQVIQRLRRFLRKEDAVRQAEDLRHTIEEAASLAMLGAERGSARLEVHVAAEVPQVMIDRVQVQQVVLNLCRNALEAMVETGDRQMLVVRAWPAGEGMVEISVTDSGPGLSAEVREKLFQPFVTTKAAGMGVGLSICRSIVEAHGGRMWMEDVMGGGTRFLFTLPAAGAEVARSDVRDAARVAGDAAPDGRGDGEG